MGVVHQSVHDGIVKGRIADLFMPMFNRQLAGDQDFPPVILFPSQTSHLTALSLHRSISFHLPIRIRSLLTFLQASQTHIAWPVLLDT